MIGRVMSRRPAAMRVLTRLQYREAILIAIAMAVVAAVGWLVTPFWVAVAVAAQLAIGGIGAVWLIGPARMELGFARYATLATAGVTLTLFGRLLVPSIGLLLTPVVALLLFGVIRLELGLTEAGQRRVGLDLALVGIVFAAAAGIGGMIPADAWPPGADPAADPGQRARPAGRGGARAERRRGGRAGGAAPGGGRPDRDRGQPAAAARAWWARPSWRWASMPGAARPKPWTTAHPGGR